MPYIDEKSFPEHVENYSSHDQECSSLPHMWIGRKGGFTDWAELFSCSICHITFFYEGAKWLDDDYDYPACSCCFDSANSGVV